MTVSKQSRIARYVLLTGVSLLSLSCIGKPSVVLAQAVIDNSAETVIGTGGGTQASPWNSLYLFVGSIHKGSLSIADGGKVATEGGRIGFDSGSLGAVTVSGAGSIWENSITLRVGEVGNGSLSITDGGQVASKYGIIGSYLGSNGTVTVSGAGSSWVNSDYLTIGWSSRGSLSIANGASVSVAGNVTLALEPGSSGKIVVGDELDASKGGGTFSAGKLIFGSGAAEIIFNHSAKDDAPATFTASMSGGMGTGTIRQLSGATLLKGDSSGFQGDTQILGGKLYVEGDFSQAGFVAEKGVLRINGQANRVTVKEAGVLEGISSNLPAGKVNVASLSVEGGTLKPGNSPGTIRLGSYVQSGGTILFERGDMIEVVAGVGGDHDGRAILARGSNGAPVNLSLVDSIGYTFGNRYTFVTAVNGVSFATPDAVQVSEVGVSRLFSQFKAEAVGNIGQFYLERSRLFTDVAWTPNQFAVAYALDAKGIDGRTSVNSLYNAIASATTDQAYDVRLAFDQVSGQIYPSTQGVLVDESRHLRDATNARVRDALSGAGSSVQAERRVSGSGSDIGLWGQGYGSWGHAGQLGQSSKLSLSTGGFVLGADGAVGDHWRFGFAGGYGTSTIENKLLLSKADVDNYHAAVYGGGRFGALGVQFGLGHTWHSTDTSRHLSVASLGLRDAQGSKNDARTLQVYGEANYTIGLQYVTLEPFVNLAYVSHSSDGIIERDAGFGTALYGRLGNVNTGFSTVGLRVEHAVEVGSLRGNLHGTLGLRHAFGDITPGALFMSSQTSAFSIIGTPIVQNAVVLGAGADFAITDTTRVGIAYNGQMGKNAQDHGVKGYFHIRF